MTDIISKLADLESEVKPKYPATLNLLRMARNGNRVKRYHTVDTLVTETVGHHSANVAQIVLALDPTCSKDLLVAALNHDLVEQYTGDVPATAKWASHRLSSALKEVEDAYNLPFAIEITSYEKCLLKQADMLDLCFKCVEELHLGNTQIRPLIRRGLQFLRENNPSSLTEYLVNELERELR